jgi:hypothetical protein
MSFLRVKGEKPSYPGLERLWSPTFKTFYAVGPQKA